METFSDEQKEILNYFCTQIAKKFDFYEADVFPDNLEDKND